MPYDKDRKATIVLADDYPKGKKPEAFMAEHPDFFKENPAFFDTEPGTKVQVPINVGFALVKNNWASLAPRRKPNPEKVAFAKEMEKRTKAAAKTKG